MLRKSLFLSLTAMLIAGLMFTGCPSEIEYRDVPGPTVEVQVPGETITVEVPGPGFPIPGPTVTVTVEVEPDVVVTSGSDLVTALENPDNKVILLAATVPIDLAVKELEIPEGTSLWLYSSLSLAPDIDTSVLTVKGKVFVAANAVLSAGEYNQVAVTGNGVITLLQNGVLATEGPAYVNNGAGSTALGTDRVKIDGEGVVLAYTVVPETLDLVKEAYNNYLTQGIFYVEGFKLSELVTVATDAKKALSATAKVSETATELTIPANAYLTAALTDNLGEVTKLDVNGSLIIPSGGTPANVLAKLTDLTINGRLDTVSTLPKVTNLAIDGDLVGSEALFATVESLTVTGDYDLPKATFAKLKDLVIEEGASLNAAIADFKLVTSLSIGKGGSLTAPNGTFAALTGSLTVDEGVTITAPKGTFAALDNRLEVKGTLSVGGSATASFAKVKELVVTSTGVVDVTTGGTAFAALETLTVEKGVKTGAGVFTTNSTLAKVKTLTLNGVLTATNATYAVLETLTVADGVSFDAGSVTLAKVANLTLDGTLNASSATFAAITTVNGAGKLVAGPVATTGAESKAWVLFDSSLGSVTLGSTAALAKDITVPAGKTRIFSGVAPSWNITVDKGGTLVFTGTNAAPGSASTGSAVKEINVGGTLVFEGAGAAPAGKITVTNGGSLIFEGANAAPVRDITVNGGGTVAFKGAGAVPAGNIKVDGQMDVADGATVTIAADKTLEVSGILKATDLEVKGLTYETPTGQTLVITGNYATGSTIAAGTGIFTLAGGGYIRDTTPKKPWTLLGGNQGGTLVYTGGSSKTITLGAGKIVTTDAPSATEGVVTLTGNASIVVNEYKGGGTAIGLTLEKVVIDLTDGGRIVVEPRAKLNLAGATAATEIAGAGVITTDNASSTSGKGLAGGGLVKGDLTDSSGVSTALGLITGSSTITIDANDAFEVTGDGLKVNPAL